MGRYFSGLSTVVSPPRLRADASSSASYNTAFFGGHEMPEGWGTSLTASGVNVSPELAMTLAALYCGVTTISYDLATLPIQVFKYREDGGKDRIQPGLAGVSVRTGGINDLAYHLRWQPNRFQTATEFFLSMFWQWLLRARAYAEIVDGPTGFLDQLIPRHPDRVWPERLPSGRLRYKLIEANGQPRYLTQDEMFVVRDLSMDGVHSTSRVQYGAGVIGSALAAERAAGKFFKHGMTAATVATYKGAAGMEEEEIDAMHRAITRYASGVENTLGVMLIPDDITISNLGVEPDKAQMMLAREWGAREVARLLRIPPRKLMIAGTASYASSYQDAIDYVVGCLRPIAVAFEQCIQRDLILAQDTYFAEFQLAALLRGDPVQQATFIQMLIDSRVMRPSEARLTLNMNPDPALDKLSETDNKPGQPAAAPGSRPARKPGADPADPNTGNAPPPDGNAAWRRASMKGLLAVHDNAVRCLRRERHAVERLAKKHASDVPGWQAALREFYGDHAAFVAETMRLPMGIARGYAADHGSALETQGIVWMNDACEREEADELTGLALEAA